MFADETYGNLKLASRALRNSPERLLADFTAQGDAAALGQNFREGRALLGPFRLAAAHAKLGPKFVLAQSEHSL